MEARIQYREAVTNDGRYVLGQVVTHLYKGCEIRPDVYFSTDSNLKHKNYKAIFDSHQRSTIERSGSEFYYNIESGVRHFDVSLLTLLAEHTCGLSSWDNLLNKVKEVNRLRNKLCHESDFYFCDVSDGNLREKLQELLGLFNEIIDELDSRVFGDVYPIRYEIQRRIKERMPPTAMVSVTRPARSRTDRAARSGDIPTWGKVAIGAVAVTGFVGLIGSLLSDDNDTKQKRRNK